MPRKEKRMCFAGVNTAKRGQLVERLEAYCTDINEKSLPVIESLGMNSGIRQVIRYATPGGVTRLKSDFLELYSSGGAREAASAAFDNYIAKHPFVETATKSKWNKALRLSATKGVCFDPSTVEELISIYRHF